MISEIKNRLASPMAADVSWTILGQMLVMLCALAVNKCCSLSFSIEDFGRYNIVKSSCSVLSFMMLGGLGIAVPRYLAIHKSQRHYRAVIDTLIAAICYLTILVTLICTVCLLFHQQVILMVSGNDTISSLLAVLSYSFSLAVSTFLYSYYRGIGKFKVYTLIQISFAFLSLFPLASLSHLSIDNLFFSWAFLNLGLCAYLSFRIINGSGYLKFWKADTVRLKASFHEITKYSLPRLVGDFFLFSMSAFPVLYIGNTGNLKMASLFSVGLFFVKMGQPIFSFLGVVLLPYVSNRFATRQVREADKMISKILLVEVGIAILMIVTLLVLMPFWITLFFSGNYKIATECAQILVLSILPSALYLLYRNPIDAVSVIPYNTIILSISFMFLVTGFWWADKLVEFAWVYVGTQLFQGCGSYACWKYLKHKNK